MNIFKSDWKKNFEGRSRAVKELSTGVLTTVRLMIDR